MDNFETTQKKKSSVNYLFVFLLLGGFFIAVYLLGGRIGGGISGGGQNPSIRTPAGQYFAVVGVYGTIQNASSSFSTSAYYNHGGTLNYIKTLAEDSNNCGIFLDLDTPGGSVYESDELYLALMAYKEATGRPIFAYMNHQACSGGYYVAMAADEIWGNRNGITGSIGVIISISNYTGLYEQLGIGTEYIISGENKTMGAADLPLTEEQRAIYQSVVDEAYDQFTGIICAGRGLTKEVLLPLADGRIYTTTQALELNLIDGVSNREDALALFESQTGAEPFYVNLTQYSYLDRLFAKIQDITPKSEAEIIAAMLENAHGGTPFYLLP